jgi:hypothetical protein
VTSGWTACQKLCRINWIVVLPLPSGYNMSSIKSNPLPNNDWVGQSWEDLF